MNSYGQTDTGRVRKSNQDSIFLSETAGGTAFQPFLWSPTAWAGIRPGILRPGSWWIPWSAVWDCTKSDSPVTALRKAIEKDQ